MAEGLSGYESPSFVYALVFSFFLVMSILIEKILEIIEHYLARLGRNGLKVALNLIVKEVMMLGFISLLLTVIENPVSEICVKKISNRDRWVAISLVSECDSCLKDTRKISAAYKEEHHCPFWEDDNDVDHHQDEISHHHDTEDDHAGRRRLLAGGGEHNVCGEGEEPLISKALLHEVHITIFLLTVMHIVTVVIMVVLSSWKLNRWRKWKLEDDCYVICVTSRLQEVTLEADDKSGNEAPEVIVNADASAPSTSGEGSTEVAPSDNVLNDSGRTINSGGGKLKILRRTDEIPKDEQSRNGARWQAEWFISFFKQFYKPMTQVEFRIMRAAFMLEHRQSNIDFMTYLTKSLDDDVCSVVTISTPGWITLIGVIFLWAPVKFTGWFLLLVVILFVLTLLLICTKLVTVVRHVTRGKRINKLDPGFFWFSNPKLLLPVVQYTLFVNSAIFAVMVSLALEYGPRSCHFYGHHDNGDAGPWTWVLVLLFNLGSFFHISFIMLPLYSLVVHMGSTHWTRHLINEDVANKLLELRRKVAKDHNASAPHSSAT